MALSIDRLRIWLLVGAALLVAVIAGFLGYAQYRAHRFLAGLPAKLGVDIRRETNGYTYSQSVGGKTVMTLHAAKAVEHQNGKLTLRDVDMTLYGRKQDRMDHISGSEFEYEQKAGVVRAMGEVMIDLERPGGESETQKADKDDDRQVIHVKTSGLVYLQKLGVAATDKDLEFRFGGMTGHAIGAEYNSDTGVLILQREVKVNGKQGEKPILLTASHAELERNEQRALLTQASYTSSEVSMRGDHAIVHLRQDGSPERIEAEGGVALKSPKTGEVTAPQADVLLTAQGQARSAHLFGGVQYAETSSLRQGAGHADDAQLAFDPRGQLENAVLTGAVHVKESVRPAEASPWSQREATAGTLHLAFAGDKRGKREISKAEATQAAHLKLVSDADTPAETASELSGESLTGLFSGGGKTTLLTSIRGSGRTALRRQGVQGAEQTSTGDSLDITLRPASAHGGRGEEIAKAVQTGHVQLTSRSAAKPGETAEFARASADLGVYDGDADSLTLTGHAQAVQGTGTVASDRIVMRHASGDATAEGAVKATYASSDASEPAHVLADRAQWSQTTSRAVFYGASKVARLWQGASQVEAAVIELDQKQGTLKAHGTGSETVPNAVHAVFAGNQQNHPEQSPVIRVASRTLVYSDTTRQAEFSGDVLVEGTEGTLRARQATAYLHPAPPAGQTASNKDTGKGSSNGVPFGGSVDRIVATGQIEIQQPGRHASGEELVYTASDGMFVLTGTPAVPPRLIDEAQGTVTATTLRFHTGDNRVIVTGAATAPSQRVHTVTRVRQK
ncbi:MAG TPA: LptA/OstA family protein [Granulicella sp.]